MAMIRCKECGSEMSDSALGCPKCGSTFQFKADICKKCGFKFPAYFAVCPVCGEQSSESKKQNANVLKLIVFAVVCIIGAQIIPELFKLCQNMIFFDVLGELYGNA